MALKLPDSAVPMGDFPVAKAVDIDFDDGENLQEKLDNGKLGGGGNTTDLTDLENRVTTNETNITDLQEQIDNLDIPEDVDLTEINNKLTQLETNQIKKFYVDHINSGGLLHVKISLGNQYNFSKILITDNFGGCLLITGSYLNFGDYKTIKVVRLSNGAYDSHYPDYNFSEMNKIRDVYLDGEYIYVSIGSFVNVYLEGGFNTVESINSMPTGATQLPILDLTQQTDLTGINAKLIQLENTINQVGGGGIYTSGEVEVGKWINGQTLYRTTLAANKSMTITSTSQGKFETLVLGNINPSEYRVVKMEGSFKYKVDNSNSKTCVLPCAFADNDMVMNMAQSSTTGDIILQGKNMPVCNITDIYVCIYYYKN